jgi:hypothetical protein
MAVDIALHLIHRNSKTSAFAMLKLSCQCGAISWCHQSRSKGSVCALRARCADHKSIVTAIVEAASLGAEPDGPIFIGSMGIGFSRK